LIVASAEEAADDAGGDDRAAGERGQAEDRQRQQQRVTRVPQVCLTYAANFPANLREPGRRA